MQMLSIWEAPIAQSSRPRSHRLALLSDLGTRPVGKRLPRRTAGIRIETSSSTSPGLTSFGRQGTRPPLGQGLHVNHNQS